MSAASTRTPTFLLIGAARCGTTFLARQLDRHPELSFTTPKEPHFLAFPGEQLRFSGPGDDETINRLAITDPDRWHGLFDSSAARGEGSVSTLYYHATAIATIKEHCPDARFIAVLRDPTYRAHSAWAYQLGKGYETASFEQALNDEPRRIDAGWHHLWHYEAMGHYSSQLEAFVREFGMERLLVIDHAELDSNPQSVLDRCFVHLQLEPIELGGLDQVVNQGGQPRSKTVARTIQRARGIEPVRRAAKRLVPFALRERIRSANLEHTEIPAAAHDRLHARFAGEARSLRQLLGDRAPGWARSG